MSNQALPRPRFSAPEPEQRPKAALKLETRATPLLHGKVSEVPDVCFGWAMRICGLAVVALPGFDRVPARGGLAALLACVWLEVLLAIGLESGRGSIRRAAVHLRHRRLLAAVAGNRRALIDRRRRFHYRDVSGRSARHSFLHHRTAGRHPQRGLWTLGNLCSRADSSRICPALSRQNSRLDRRFSPVRPTASACSLPA